jgi:hypothetical protein
MKWLIKKRFRNKEKTVADYMVGKGSGGKDRYMIGWNKSKENSSAYKVGVGSGGKSGDTSKNVGGDQDSVVGGKSNFKGPEVDYKDVGSKSDAANFGGTIGSAKYSADDGDLEYTETGSWDMKKDAMARRKALADAMSSLSGDNDVTPLVGVKKAK